jgi:riboflavin kinase/FMN adenylyltransferase
MQLFHAFDEITQPLSSVCTVGTFDGVHLGHQQLIHSVVSDAKARGVQAAIITFFPHPRIVLGRAPAKYLTLPSEKADAMAALGVAIIVQLEFSLTMAQTPASQFVDWMVDHLGMRSLWVGHDFALGHKRQGDAVYLQEAGRRLGFDVNVITELNLGREAISSTRIRDALAHGDVRDASLCLGRPFAVRAEYDGKNQLCVDPLHWLPAPGNYQVLIEGRVNEATLSIDSPCGITLQHALREGRREIVVEFV